MLLAHLANHLRDKGDAAMAETFMKKSRDLNRRASELEHIPISQDDVSEENLRQEKMKEEGPD